MDAQYSGSLVMIVERCGARPPFYKEAALRAESQPQARTQTPFKIHQYSEYTPQPRLSTHYAASGLLPRQLVGQETLVGSEIMRLLSSNSPKADELRCALA